MNGSPVTSTSENSAATLDARARASLSEGHSSDPVVSTVARTLGDLHRTFDRIVDLGCGAGSVSRKLAGLYRSYVGCDVVRYPGFEESSSVRFQAVDLNQPPFSLDAASADAVVSIETIEHLENPRALLREMTRIARPGGWVLVTTPNQLSLASKAWLVCRNQFQAFREAPGLYPAHITALVEEDLRRIARECGLTSIAFRYTDHGRIPFTGAHWPSRWGLRGRTFSDNVVMLAQRS
jgi:2-polyprenyl-3-methyl-5-hydroxy-6-metoxy-1,4-benzoquinol methylase